MSNETKSGGASANTREMVAAELSRICKIVTDKDATYSEREAAGELLKAVDSVLSFNEYLREKGNPDDALEDMGELDTLAEMGGDWSKPSYMLARAFYGYRFNPWHDDANGREREAFNPNDDYFTFNGYGNLVSVPSWAWAGYWGMYLDVCYYLDYAEELGNLEEIADALGDALIAAEMGENANA